MKRFLGVILAAALAASLAVPSLAHGGHHRAKAVSYTVCTVESCAQTGLHAHSGRYYQAHHIDDGHSYHGYCSVENCALTGYHSHDGVYCFAHYLGDGHDHHTYCPIEGCQLTGYHSHDGLCCFAQTAIDGSDYYYAGRHGGRHH